MDPVRLWHLKGFVSRCPRWASSLVSYINSTSPQYQRDVPQTMYTVCSMSKYPFQVTHMTPVLGRMEGTCGMCLHQGHPALVLLRESSLSGDICG